MARPLTPERVLRALVKAVTGYLRAFDWTMANVPAGNRRDKTIAKLNNDLEMAKDYARFFGLNIDFRTGKPRTSSQPNARQQRTPAPKPRKRTRTFIQVEPEENS